MTTTSLLVISSLFLTFFIIVVILIFCYSLLISCCISLKGSEWKEKAETFELELQQCYKAQSRLSEQLVVEVAECRASKALLQEKEDVITDLQNEIAKAR